MLSSYLGMPRIGYLEQELHISGYLKLHPKSKLVFDPAHPSINEKRFFIVTRKSFIGIPVKQYQGTNQCLEVVSCEHTDLWMQTMMGKPKQDVLRLKYCCSVIRRQSSCSEIGINW